MNEISSERVMLRFDTIEFHTGRDWRRIELLCIANDFLHKSVGRGMKYLRSVRLDAKASAFGLTFD